MAEAARRLALGAQGMWLPSSLSSPFYSWEVLPESPEEAQKVPGKTGMVGWPFLGTSRA